MHERTFKYMLANLARALAIALLVPALEAQAGGGSAQALIDSIDAALDLAKSSVHRIVHSWQVRSYPNFLQASGLSADGWDLMKMKLQDKVLSAAITGRRAKWVTAFMGSSVTAGRDSPVNASFVALTQKMMRAPSAPWDFSLSATRTRTKVRSPATVCLDSAHLTVRLISANPCMPYDLCVHAYAGPDADVVHWEQSYDCFSDEEYLEAFIRSAQLLPNKPIVVISVSATENWEPSACTPQPPPHVLTALDKTLLKTYHSSSKELFTVSNAKYDVHRQEQHFKDYYKAAGVQTFWHQAHQKYKCLGPFTKDWQGDCLSWHPSVKGNQLRAGHYVLLWMSIFADALAETRQLLATMRVEDASRVVRAKLDAYHLGNPLPARRHTSDTVMPDAMQCWTNNEPRTDRSTSLTDALIDRGVAGTLAANAIDLDTWYVVVADRLYYGDAIFHRNHVEIGYKDYKVSLVGNAASGPVSLFFTARSSGKMVICDVAQNWGAFKTQRTGAGDYGRLFKHPPQVYASPSSAGTRPESFVFDSKAAKLLSFERYRDSEECIRSKDKVDQGPFVLTIVPTDERRLVITYILIP